MPNWVYCNANVTGPANVIRDFMEVAASSSRYHNNSNLADWGAFTDIQLEALMQEAKADNLKPNNAGFSFHSLYPMPLAVQILPYDPDAFKKAIDNNESIKAFSQKHKADLSGYEWENLNWGVKWGDCSTSILNNSPTHVEIYFETAWGFPVDFWKKVSGDYPELTITINFEEEAGFFAGEAFFEGGEVEINEWEPERKVEEED